MLLYFTLCRRLKDERHFPLLTLPRNTGDVYWGALSHTPAASESPVETSVRTRFGSAGDRLSMASSRWPRNTWTGIKTCRLWEVLAAVRWKAQSFRRKPGAPGSAVPSGIFLSQQHDINISGTSGPGFLGVYESMVKHRSLSYVFLDGVFTKPEEEKKDSGEKLD